MPTNFLTEQDFKALTHILSKVPEESLLDQGLIISDTHNEGFFVGDELAYLRLAKSIIEAIRACTGTDNDISSEVVNISYIGIEVKQIDHFIPHNSYLSRIDYRSLIICNSTEDAKRIARFLNG